MDFWGREFKVGIRSHFLVGYADFDPDGGDVLLPCSSTIASKLASFLKSGGQEPSHLK